MAFLADVNPYASRDRGLNRLEGRANADFRCTRCSFADCSPSTTTQSGMSAWLCRTNPPYTLFLHVLCAILSNAMPTISHNSDGLAAQLKTFFTHCEAFSPLFSPCLWRRSHSYRMALWWDRFEEKVVGQILIERFKFFLHRRNS